jgi:hypothetical protein
MCLLRNKNCDLEALIDIQSPVRCVVLKIRWREKYLLLKYKGDLELLIDSEILFRFAEKTTRRGEVYLGQNQRFGDLMEEHNETEQM